MQHSFLTTQKQVNTITNFISFPEERIIQYPSHLTHNPRQIHPKPSHTQTQHILHPFTSDDPVLTESIGTCWQQIWNEYKIIIIINIHESLTFLLFSPFVFYSVLYFLRLEPTANEFANLYFRSKMQIQRNQLIAWI